MLCLIIYFAKNSLTLFWISRCLEPTAGEENLEYTKQLILGSLLNICQKLSPDGNRIKAGKVKTKVNFILDICQCLPGFVPLHGMETL